MTKRIKIRIFPDGRVEAETRGIKGAACTKYLPVLEELLRAKVIESSYTSEYYEQEGVQIQARNEQHATGD